MFHSNLTFEALRLSNINKHSSNVRDCAEVIKDIVLQSIELNRRYVERKDVPYANLGIELGLLVILIDLAASAAGIDLAESVGEVFSADGMGGILHWSADEGFRDPGIDPSQDAEIFLDRLTTEPIGTSTIVDGVVAEELLRLCEDGIDHSDGMKCRVKVLLPRIWAIQLVEEL